MKKIICVLLITALMTGCSSFSEGFKDGYNGGDGKSSDKPSSAISEQETSPEKDPVEEVVKHCSFDSFALEVFETGANCDIVSHETIEKDNGDFQWKIVIENVVDFNALMTSSALVGAAVNQNIQWTILQDGAQPVKSVMISIGEDGKAILMFFPPIGYGNLLTCSFVATDSYDRKEEASDAYINSPLYEYDILKSLENLMSEQVAKAAKEANLANK